MLTRAVFLPDTELLLPGRSGAQLVIPAFVAHSSQLVQESADASQQIVVVYPAARPAAAPIGRELLARAQFRGAIDYLPADEAQSSNALADVGQAKAANGPVTFLVLGSGSARRTPDAPLPVAPGALQFDETALAALGSGVPTQLRDLPGDDAAALGATGWAPWQVVSGAAAANNTVTNLQVEDSLGAFYVAACWRPS